jgi:hypothetical protein
MSSAAPVAFRRVDHSVSHVRFGDEMQNLIAKEEADDHHRKNEYDRLQKGGPRYAELRNFRRQVSHQRSNDTPRHENPLFLRSPYDAAEQRSGRQGRRPARHRGLRDTYRRRPDSPTRPRGIALSALVEHRLFASRHKGDKLKLAANVNVPSH